MFQKSDRQRLSIRIPVRSEYSCHSLQKVFWLISFGKKRDFREDVKIVFAGDRNRETTEKGSSGVEDEEEENGEANTPLPPQEYDAINSNKQSQKHKADEVIKTAHAQGVKARLLYFIRALTHLSRLYLNP